MLEITQDANYSIGSMLEITKDANYSTGGDGSQKLIKTNQDGNYFIVGKL